MATEDATEPAPPDGVRPTRQGLPRRRPAHAKARRASAVPDAERRRVSVPGLVWAATALSIGVMVVFSVVYPAYWAFDETGHVSRVLAAQNGRTTPTPGADPYVTGVARSYTDYASRNQPPFMDHALLARADRPTMLELGGARPYEVPGALPNQLAQHPPGYYLFAAGVLDIVPGSQHLAWDQTVGLLRLLDIVLLAPLPLLCWATARRFARERVAVAASFAPALIPGLARLGASTNNDDMLILLFGVFTYLLVKVLHGDGRVRTGVAIGACVAAALLVKGFALILPVVALIAYLLLWRRSRSLPWQPFVPVIVGSALGGLWWLRNLIVYGVVQPAGLTPAQAAQVWPPLPPGKHMLITTFARKSVDVFTTDFWGALGLAAPPSLPGAITVVASVLAGVFCVLAFLRGRRAKASVYGERPSIPVAGSRITDFVVLLLPTLLLLFPLLAHSWSDFQRTGQPVGIQGRYLYPGLVGLVAICAAGVGWLVSKAPGWVERLLPLTACLLAIAIEVAAFHTVLVKLWLPPTRGLGASMRDVAHAIGEQSPWPGTVTMGLLAFAAASAIVALAAAAWGVLAPRASGWQTDAG